jgi:hypothetical protein
MLRQMLAAQTEMTCPKGLQAEAGLFGCGGAYWRRFYFYYYFACVPGKSLHARGVMPD